MPSKNPDIIARARQCFADKNPDYLKQWHVENPGRRKTYQSRYESANMDKIREKGRRYYAENRETLRERQRVYRAAHPEKAAERQMRKNFGISLDEKKVLWLAQNKCCRICTRKITLLSAHIDHVHGFNPIIIRGLLCGSCNRGLGLFQDEPTYLDRAATYLRLFTPSTVA